MSFKQFSEAVNAKYNQMCKRKLFVVDADKNDLWNTYLDSFPEEENPIYKERRFYDCQCCKNFIRNIAGVVSIEGNVVDSIWNVDVEYPFNLVAETMHEEVVNRKIKSSFFSKEDTAGKESTLDITDVEDIKQWDHLWAVIPKKFIESNKEERIGKQAGFMGVFRRGLEELNVSTLDQIIELIETKKIYRGEEHLKAVKGFRMHILKFMESGLADAYVWNNIDSKYIGFRNTVIGTLAVDIEKGVDLEKAVKSFENKVAPSNYKRTTSLITPTMIKKAMEKVEELGISDSLKRRFAKTDDVSINNVIFADRTTQALMKGNEDLTSLLMEETTTKKIDKSKVKSISIEDFISNIVPKANLIEAMVENSKINNLMSVVAPQHEDSPPILKWNNNFSWSYNNNTTDSEMTQAVISAGGRVDGVLRFTHSWNYDKRNASLMDLHVFCPGNRKRNFGVNDSYGKYAHVGWNNRNLPSFGGKQDVDYTSEAPTGYVPVENITFSDMSKLKDGEYTCAIHNWKFRAPTKGGFKAEIAFGDQVFSYEHKKPLANKEWVVVAVITLKNGVFTIDHKLKPDEAGKREWNINTNQFTKVNMIMNSPNHWDDNEEGNKHTFFILDNCLNPDRTRGIYNEFLKGSLHEHRKVFEVIGDKTKCEMTDIQLSGVGFSSTKRDEMLVKVDGKPFNIKF